MMLQLRGGPSGLVGAGVAPRCNCGSAPPVLRAPRRTAQRGLHSSSSIAVSGRAPLPVRFREEGRAEEDAQQSVERNVERRVERATAKVARQMSGVLSSPDTQARAYWLLGCVTLATAAACLVAPGQVGGAMLGGNTDAVVDSQIRAAGATLLASATVQLTLKEAALRGQLHLDTFRRLQFGLAAKWLACLVLAAQAVSLQNGLLKGYMAAVCGSGLLLSARMIALTAPSDRSLPVLPSPGRTLAAVVGLLMPRNAQAGVYSVLALALAAMAGVCWSARPGAGLWLFGGVHGSMTVFAQRAAGSGLLLMTVVAVSLKDGADRQRLGATTFRWLNLGLAGSFLLLIGNLASDAASGLLVHGSSTLVLVAALLAAAGWTGHQYMSAPQPQASG